jgi:hypothetical protein
MKVAEYEAWLYADAGLESRVGPAMYLDLISADYRDDKAVRRARKELEAFARADAPLSCECVALPDIAVIDMGNEGEALLYFEQVRNRGEPYWWLHAARCSMCGTGWLVAQEERHNDVFVLRRLTADELKALAAQDNWPPDFDTYETLLRLGRDTGRSVRYADPVGSSDLEWTMADLARQRPGINVGELAELLNLDDVTAAMIARKAIRTHGVSIRLRDMRR